MTSGPQSAPTVTVDGDTVRLHGAGAIRAMAHPARLRVVDELYSDTAIERTATELAALCGLTPSAMSYHLRALERAGLVLRAPARGDGRERPWRGRGRTLSIDNSDVDADGGDVLAGLAFDRTRALFGAWVAYRREHGADRPRLSALSNGMLWLTKSEAAALAAEIDAVVQRRRDVAPDADRYAWSWALFPDVGSPDVGSPDVGSPDAGSPDAGSPDVSSPDVRAPDVTGRDITGAGAESTGSAAAG